MSDHKKLAWAGVGVYGVIHPASAYISFAVLCPRITRSLPRVLHGDHACVEEQSGATIRLCVDSSTTTRGDVTTYSARRSSGSAYQILLPGGRRIAYSLVSAFVFLVATRM